MLPGCLHWTSASPSRNGMRAHTGAGTVGAAPPLSVFTAELMERAAVPPLWPALYPPGRSPLHHAQQLQLFSQQHFLRQQELLYLQQQAAQALELQRSAQLVVSPGPAVREESGGQGGLPGGGSIRLNRGTKGRLGRKAKVWWMAPARGRTQ